MTKPDMMTPMAILSHGSDLTMAPTLGPMVRQSGKTVRKAVVQLAAQRFTALQLDAALSGIRPRDLDQRARRDLTALLARHDLRLAGLDLFVPRRHYLADEHIDRALSATVAAIELAADLGRVPVSLAMPVADMPRDALDAVVNAADGHGVRVAVHAEDQLDELLAWVKDVDLPCVGCGLDPAALITHGQDPLDALQQVGSRLAIGRLSDAGAGDAVRCLPGAGELDVIAYRIAIDLNTARTGPVVLDLRGLGNTLQAAGDAKTVWDDAGFNV